VEKHYLLIELTIQDQIYGKKRKCNLDTHMHGHSPV